MQNHSSDTKDSPGGAFVKSAGPTPALCEPVPSADEHTSLALCAIVCRAKSFRAIETFCPKNKKFYCEWLDLPHGIPSHDTFARVFQVVDPEELIGALTEWVLDLRARRGESGRPLVAGVYR